MKTKLDALARLLLLALCCTQLSAAWSGGAPYIAASAHRLGESFQPQAAPDARVLESTIEIVAVHDVVSYDDHPRRRLVGAVGVMSLGALVYQDGRPKLYTHNHYAANPDFPLAGVDRVLFLNAQGEFVAQVSGQEFRGLLAAAQNPGTALVDAPLPLRPEALARLEQVSRRPKYAQLGDARRLARGDVVSVPQRGAPGAAIRREALAVAPALVESTDQRGSGSVPVIRLQLASGLSLVGGDSGGPIWFHGQVVGNTWSTVLDQMGQNTNEFWAAQAGPALQGRLFLAGY